MGTDDLLDYMRKYNLTMKSYFQKHLDRYPKRPLKSFVNKSNSHLATEEALDLLSKMLLYDKN